MIGCLCGGIFEAIVFGVAFAFAGLTYLYDKLRYKRYVDYHKKHQSCSCDCHKEEKVSK